VLLAHRNRAGAEAGVACQDMAKSHSVIEGCGYCQAAPMVQRQLSPIFEKECRAGRWAAIGRRSRFTVIRAESVIGALAKAPHLPKAGKYGHHEKQIPRSPAAAGDLVMTIHESGLLPTAPHV